MITITIAGDTFAETLKEANALANFLSSTPDSAPQPAPYMPVAVASPTTPPAAPVQPQYSVAPPPAGAIPAPAAQPAGAPVTPPPAAQAPTAPPPTYTYEQVGKAGADLAAANPGIMPTLSALLQRYGVQLVTDLKPEQLGPFATELRGLGAKI